MYIVKEQDYRVVLADFCLMEKNYTEMKPLILWEWRMTISQTYFLNRQAGQTDTLLLFIRLTINNYKYLLNYGKVDKITAKLEQFHVQKHKCQ